MSSSLCCILVVLCCSILLPTALHSNITVYKVSFSTGRPNCFRCTLDLSFALSPGFWFKPVLRLCFRPMSGATSAALKLKVYQGSLWLQTFPATAVLSYGLFLFSPPLSLPRHTHNCQQHLAVLPRSWNNQKVRELIERRCTARSKMIPETISRSNNYINWFGNNKEQFVGGAGARVSLSAVNLVKKNRTCNRTT